MIALPCVLDVTLLGAPVRFESNSEEVIAHAMALVRDYGGSPSGVPSSAPLHVRITLDASLTSDECTTPRYESGTHGRLMLVGAGILGVVEPLRRESLAFVSSERLRAGTFRLEILEAMTFALLACFDRHPVHASAIARGGHALLLAGASGAGKSTLALAAHRAGFHVLSEDRVWVQLDPSLRVWGGPPRVRIRETDGAKSAVPLSRDDTAPVSAAHATVCVLARGDTARLDRLTAADVHGALAQQLAPGFDRFPERHPRVVDALVPHGGWQLTLSPDPQDAVPFFDIMLAEHRR